MNGPLRGHTSTLASRQAPPGIDYVEQRSTELAYYLYESPAPRWAVRVLAERTLPLPRGQITLAVIGSSHFLEIRFGPSLLCELLACAHPALDAVGGRLRRVVGGDSWELRLRRRAMEYRIELRRDRLSPKQFEMATVRMSEEGHDRLHFCFPPHDGQVGAVTCLDWRVEASTATVDTYHTFPGELTIVQTRSVIDLAEAGAAS